MARQTRTVLFTDVEGSTRVRTTRGDDAGDLAIAMHDEVVSRAVADHDGRIVKGTGDGTLAIFESARAAVAAAVAIQRDLERRRRRSDGVDVRVRIGINAGEVLDQEGDVLGEAVNAAARILGEAHGSEIFVSRVVRDLVGTTEVAFTDRGDRELRGFPEPWRLYDVQWATGDDAAVPLQIRLLGQVAVTLNGASLRAFESARLQHLLARLVLHPGRHVSRVQLSFELWPDSDERQARTNLRKLLHDLRRAVPDADHYVEIDGQSLFWRVDAPAAVDVIDFDAAMDAGELSKAVDGYGGDFLPGLYDDWILAERDRLRALAIDALARLAEEAADRDDAEATLAYGRRLLGLDPLREDGYRLLMRAHARRGERADALRAYHRGVEILDRELGVEPDAATNALYQELRAGSGATAAPPATRVVTSATSLVGREDEWERSIAAWNTAAAGRASLLLVSGEPGIGKSRLVDEVARFVAAEGNVVARARSYQGAGRLPWGPVAEWLRSDALRAGVAGLPAVRRAELARLLPELRSGASEADGAPGASDSGGRHELFEAIAAALLESKLPTMLVIDDLQWSDADTIDVIGFLLQSVPTAPILVAGTARTEEIDDDHPFRRVRAALFREGTAIELPLAPLDAGATTDLAVRLTGTEVDGETAKRLWDETEGNPLFIIEAMRAGLDPRAGHSLSPTVQAVIGARLAQLSPAARAVVEMAAVVGREFQVDLVATAMATDEDQLVDALDELWSRRIIREHAGGYDFTHDRLREVALHSISPARRRKLHRAVAESLAAADEFDAGAVSTRLAPHYEEGGLYAEAIEAHRRAAEYAVDVFALDDAIASLRRALGLLENLPAGRRRDETELSLRVALGAPLVAREGYGSTAVQRTYERALDLCERLGVRIEPAVLRGLGLAALIASRFDRSMRYAHALLDHPEDPVAVVEGHYLMGVSEFWRGNMRESSEQLRTALDAYRPDLGPQHRALFAQDPKGVCLVRLAFTTLWSGDPDEALTFSREARQFAASIQHPTTLGYVLVWSGMCAAEVDDRRSLRESVEAAEELGSRHALEYISAIGRLLRGWLDVLDEHPKGIPEIIAAADGWRVEEHPHLTYALALLARCHLRSGDLDAGREAALEGIEWGIAHDDRWTEAELRTIDAELLARSGDTSAAEQGLRVALAVAEQQHAYWPGQRAEAALARLRTS